jgi:hypothetical protein
MKRNLIAFFIFYGCFLPNIFAQLQSPDQFLGYKIGERYTPHWRIVDYFKHVAANAPTLVKLQQYGQTYEGRPLYTAFISSAANISNLEAIRSNNMALAQGNKTAKASGAPALVWLSYNVHGNETSSSEVAMLTLYSLVDPANTRTKPWLQNTVVIIDPCLNPDGRDRYVNWFNSVVGVTPNPELIAREHIEPWPLGRFNHYYFDLNRDWAWQTQIESQQRIALYNQWLPQIHVDFHEQYINNPYYFAPAAQPYHEVITTFQRSFQETIGRNHARYFDEQGWLYFTREVFDLLYPSYGDTWPTFNGAIGMTYEQAGHSLGGAAAITAVGDTLTLLDRVTHHLTTGLSTIEVASQHANRLITEFQKFFTDATTGGIGDYKSYIIKYSDRDAERIDALMNLLIKNDIKFGTTRATNLRGFNYENGRNEAFSIAANDLVIPSVQPKSAFVKVLFEPNTTVVDSNTYDITAWALPYAYGLKAYASPQRVELTSSTVAKVKANNPSSDPYGYVIRWNGVQTVRLVSELLQKGLRLRFNEEPFTVGGQVFDRGSIIILRTGNQYIPNFWTAVRELATANNVQLTPVSSGFVDKGTDFGSAKVRFLKRPKVALLSGEGITPPAVGEVWYYFDQEIKYPVTLINLSDLNRARLSDFDVIIMPNGNYRFLNDKAAAEQFKNWIEMGGRVIALENAVSQLAKTDWGIKSKKGQEDTTGNPYEVLRRYENRERDYIRNVTPGSIFRVEMDNTHPLAFGFPGYYYTLKQDDNMYEFIREGGWNVGVIKKEKQIAGFVGSKLSRRLQDGLIFGTQELGRGNIVYLSDNVLFRNFWENGKLLFSNAVFLVGQ